jgi:hypothetical protein
MTNTAATRRTSARSIRRRLGFLMRGGRGRVATVAVVVSLASLGACENRPLDPSRDASTTPDTGTPTNCANVGCALPPLCSTGCQETCGCCSCAPGERNGDLVCTSAGCYAPAPPVDAGTGVCALPFEVGPCDALFNVYAYVNGACVPRVYGGCQGNDNRFNTLEECMATCEGRPAPNGCPAGRITKEICIACGPGGGCAKSQTVCALPCVADAGASACSPSLPICADGVCQLGGCI